MRVLLTPIMGNGNDKDVASLPKMSFEPIRAPSPTYPGIRILAGSPSSKNQTGASRSHHGSAQANKAGQKGTIYWVASSVNESMKTDWCTGCKMGMCLCVANNYIRRITPTLGY